ncbi:glycerophosphodiester phosphodiesterase [Elusimicrobiota bacterium]
MIAHRGASGYEPENTLAAFRAALRMGAEEVECDVRQTKDGELVLLHDPDLSRVAGWEVSLRDLEFADRPKTGVCPRLADLIAMLSDRVELHLDLKQDDPPYRSFEECILAALDSRREWRKNTTFSSADADTLRRLRAAKGDVRLGFQPRDTPIARAFGIARELGVESLRLRRDRLAPEWVRRAHEKGIEVYVYTVDDAGTLERMRELGVDRVFTNFPDIAQRSAERG